MDFEAKLAKKNETAKRIVLKCFIFHIYSLNIWTGRKIVVTLQQLLNSKL